MSQYRVPVIVSLLLHVAIIIALVFNIEHKVSMPQFMKVTTQVELPKEFKQKKDIVDSVAVSEKTIEEHVERIQQQKQSEQDKIANEKRRAEQRLKRLQEKARQQKIAAEQAIIKREKEEKRRLAAEKEKKRQQLEAKKEQERLQKIKQQRIAEEKAAKEAEQKRLEQEAEKKRLAEEKKRKQQEAKRKAEQQRLRKLQQEEERRLAEEARTQQIEQELMQELAMESDFIDSRMSQRVKDEIEKFKAKAVSRITSKNRKPKGEYGSCTFTFTIDPAGYVIDVIENKGATCSVNLNRTGKNAIMAAQPFDVPDEPAVFDEVKVMRVTLTNKEGED